MSQCSSIILERYILSQNVAKEEKKEIQLQLIKNRPYFSFEPTQLDLLFHVVDYALFGD